MNFKIYLPFLLLLCFFNQYAWAYGEEKLDSIGNLNSVHSSKEQHSTFHYDLVRLLAIKAGYPKDSAELIARYSALVDQMNPKNNYPYTINPTSLPDTFPDWPQSLAGTERTASGINQFGENPGCYWHFAFRNPADSATTGGMVYANDFPHPVAVGYKGPPNFWRVPFSYYLDSIYNWAINGTGRPGNPNGAPKDVYYYDVASSQYKLVPGSSIVALGILLHSIGDSYSHEECAVTDTIRSHPSVPVLCDGMYHHLEMPYNIPSYGYTHLERSAQAIWRALRVYAAARGYNYTPLWTVGNGNNIPDELEETGDPAHTATFIERWKAPETTDLNSDGVINHFDHSARRIGLTLAEIATGTDDLALPQAAFEVYPNPASGVVHVRVYSTIKSTEVSVKDISGRKLITEPVTGTDVELNISGIAGGMYFVSVGGAMKKIIVK